MKKKNLSVEVNAEPEKKYYAEDAAAVMGEVETSCDGLTKDEAAKRLSENGKNELEQSKKKSLIVKFFEQFKDIMIIVLLVAAVISAIMPFIEASVNNGEANYTECWLSVSEHTLCRR